MQLRAVAAAAAAMSDCRTCELCRAPVWHACMLSIFKAALPSVCVHFSHCLSSVFWTSTSVPWLRCSYHIAGLQSRSAVSWWRQCYRASFNRPHTAMTLATVTLASIHAYAEMQRWQVLYAMGSGSNLCQLVSADIMPDWQHVI